MADSSTVPPGGCSQEYFDYLVEVQRNVSVAMLFHTLLLHVPELTLQIEEKGTVSGTKDLLLKHAVESFAGCHARGGLGHVMTQVLVVRTVDAFQYYLSRILFRVFTECPQLLKMEASVPATDVPDRGDMDDFMERMADKKVSSLSYTGLEGIMRYLKSNLKMRCNIPSGMQEAASEVVAVRNIIVHNAGKVNRRYMRRARRTELKLGEVYPLTVDYVAQSADKLLRIAERLDAEFISRFGLLPVGFDS